MISEPDARIVARRILDDWTARAPYRSLADAVPGGDLDDAYAVQSALHALMREAGEGEIVGWKIALTSKAMQAMVGVDQPLAGAIFAARVHPSPARLPAGRFVHVGIECEVAVRLGEDLPAERAPFDRAGVAAAVEACMPAFELVEDRDADYAALDAVSLVAENCWNGGNVIGAPVARPAHEWLDASFTGAATRLRIAGAPAGEGRVGDALGHPFEAVAWVANLLARRRESLRAGMLVMTGSTVVTRFPAPGEACRFEVDGLGGVDLVLSP